VSGGLSNPIVALLELAVAIGLSLLAITLPLVAGAIVVVLLMVAVVKLGGLAVGMVRKVRSS
jgi:hypothetical protein